MTPPTTPDTSQKAEVPFLIILLVNLVAAYIPSLLWVPGCPAGSKWLLFLYSPVAFLLIVPDANMMLASLTLALFFLLVALLSLFAWRSRLINLRIAGMLFVISLYQAMWVGGFIRGLNGVARS